MNSNNIIIKRLTTRAAEETVKEEYLRTHEEDIKRLEQEYGKFEDFYNNSRTIVFINENQPWPKEKWPDWFSYWEESFEKRFKSFMEKNNLRGEFEFNLQTGEAVLHTENGDKHFMMKIFCHAEIKLDADTYEVKNIAYNPLGHIEFKQID